MHRLLEAQNLQIRWSDPEVYKFPKYAFLALGNWLVCSRFSSSDNETLKVCWDLLWRIFSGYIAQVKSPFCHPVQYSQPAILCTSEHRRGSLFLSILIYSGPNNLPEPSP